MRNGLKKYFRNTTWLFTERMLRAAVGVCVGIWVIRYLGPEQYGLLSYSLSVVGIFASIASFGIDEIVVRELVKRGNETDAILGTAFAIKITGAVFILLLALLFGTLASSDTRANYYILVIASSLVFQSFNVIDQYFRAKILSQYIAYASIGSLLVSSLVKAALVLSKAPLTAFVWAVLLDAGLLAFSFYCAYRYNGLSTSYWKFDVNIARGLLVDSWPLMLSGVAVTLYMKADQVMIKNIIDSESVGYYAAAVTLAEAAYIIPIVITSSLFPAIVNAKTADSTIYYERLQILYDLLVWTAIVIALLTIYISPWLIDLLYGEDYYPAAEVLSVYVWLGLFVNPALVRSRELITDNKTYFIVVSTTIGAILNILLNYLLISMHGAIGAAWATLLARGFTFFFVPLLFSEYRRLNTVFFKSLYLASLTTKKSR